MKPVSLHSNLKLIKICPSCHAPPNMYIISYQEPDSLSRLAALYTAWSWKSKWGDMGMEKGQTLKK